MYRMIQQINNVVEDIAKIDARLDLGGLSKYVDQHINENIKNFNWNITNYNFINSPNLLVDPETMNIYCIDFDRGIWNDEKEAAYTMLISLAKQDNNVIKIIEKK